MQSMDTPMADHRPLVREASLEEYKQEPNFAKEEEFRAGLTLYSRYQYEKETYAWGMAIDLNKLRRLQQLHARLPVGKQYRRSSARSRSVLGRHMHWIRVDAYYQGDRDNPESVLPAGTVHALRKRSLRSGLPCGRHRPQHRRPERHGLQPLRGHAVLFEQLSLQSSPL